MTAESVGAWTPTYEEVRCDLCGSDDSVVVMVGSDFRYDLPGEFPVRKCNSCGLAFTSPRPTPEALSHYYPDSYASHAVLRTEHSSRSGALARRVIFGRNGIGAAFLSRVYNAFAFRAFIPFDEPGRVLDIGCGMGNYLRVWKELGWNVEGVEPSEHAADAAREACGGRIFNGFAEELDLPAERYDLVTMVHCLEHARSPRRMLQVAARVLKPGGSILIMVPNFASYERKVFGWRWYGMEIPRHLYHFTPATLSALLRAEGFSVEALGGSAQPDVAIRSALFVGGRPAHNFRGGALVRLLGHAALLPFTMIQGSTNLWAFARRGT
jgi:SAM-dependent methyltransferase